MDQEILLNTNKIAYETPQVQNLGKLSQLIQGDSGGGSDMPPDDSPCWKMCAPSD